MTKYSKINVRTIAQLALLAGLGIAVKYAVQPLKIFTGLLGIPGGALLGGLYMMWIVLAVPVTGVKFAGSLVSAVQALVTFAIGVSAPFGLMTVVIYMSSGIACDLVHFVCRYRYSAISFVVGAMLANAAGTFFTNLAIFNLPWLYLAITIVAALLSGAVGGVIANVVYKQLRRFIVRSNDDGAEPVQCEADSTSNSEVSDEE